MPEDIVGRILRLPGYGAYETIFDEESQTIRLRVRQVGFKPRYTCGGCGIDVTDVHDLSERTVRDLPWGGWRVFLIVEIHRVRCRRCGVKTERLSFLDGKHPYTRRFAAAVARDCEDAPVRRVAARWGLGEQTARRMDNSQLWRRWMAALLRPAL